MIFIDKEGLAMKKITLTALFLLAFLLTECGKGEEAQKTETLVGR